MNKLVSMVRLLYGAEKFSVLIVTVTFSYVLDEVCKTAAFIV